MKLAKETENLEKAGMRHTQIEYMDNSEASADDLPDSKPGNAENRYVHITEIAMYVMYESHVFELAVPTAMPHAPINIAEKNDIASFGINSSSNLPPLMLFLIRNIRKYVINGIIPALPMNRQAKDAPQKQ